MNLLALLTLPRRIEQIFAALSNQINQLREEQMAAKDEILAALAAEKQQVADAIAALEAKVGETLTAEDLVEIKAAVGAVYEPAPAPEPSTGG